MAEERSLVTVTPGRVAEITLDNPPLNLFTRKMTQSLAAAVAEVGGLDDCRAVIVTGAGGRAFSAGSDIGEFPEVAQRVIQDKLWAENAAFGALQALPCAVIAAIDGAAFGSGLELALCCDLRVSGAGATFGLPELGLGVIPGSGGTQRLTRVIGAARAKEMILLGEAVDAATAERIGLVHRVVETGGALDAARALGARIARLAPLAVGEAKRLVDLSTQVPLGQGLAAEMQASERVFRSADLMEGVKAFFEKRPPGFEGR